MVVVVVTETVINAANPAIYQETARKYATILVKTDCFNY